MLARELVSEMLPSLRPEETLERAAAWMEEFRVNHLPVVRGQEFLGLVFEEDLFENNQPQAPLNSGIVPLRQIYVEGYRHTLDVLRFLAEAQVSVLPVLDEGRYVGSIVQKELLLRFASIWSFREPGGVVVLEMPARDYSVARIAHLVESQNTGIMSVYSDVNPQTGLMEMTLKFNKMDLSAVEAALLQHGYTIKASYHESPDKDDLRLRYELLMSYLSDT
ncbi:MAG: CBS domain-containing protein [Flavobacteriales bacterium]|nr:CBS domain-containing protein [Flavobacteriales bacterium]MCX7651118.1 CBS domain-containing protein [Flavobacteriales bacterium]MDW8431406.1 CBS domain-containing protein [Flavobacteriales bacterium]